MKGGGFMSKLILKLSDKERSIPFSNDKKLTERANGSWRITPQKVADVTECVLLFRGQIIAEFKVGSTLNFDRFETRTTFDMQFVHNSKYVGKFLKYPTANPASIIDDKKFKDILV